MELSPSWEAANCASTQELPSILWNPKVHYHIHKSPPLVPILSQIYPVHTTPPWLRSILILSTYLRLGLRSGLFPSGFPPISYIPHSCYMPCPSHPPWLDHSNYTWRRVQVMKLEAPPYAVFSNLLSHHLSSVQIFFSAPCSRTPECERSSFTPIMVLVMQIINYRWNKDLSQCVSYEDTWKLSKFTDLNLGSRASIQSQTGSARTSERLLWLAPWSQFSLVRFSP
jgi:hypothetical protein